MFGLVERGAAFILGQHQSLPWEPLGPLQPAGRMASGRVAEPPIGVPGEEGGEGVLRRVQLQWDRPTREGETELYVLTPLPQARVSARRVAEAYGKRWRIENALQELATPLQSELNPSGYPRAALLGFCVAVVAYHVLAVLHFLAQWVRLRAFRKHPRGPKKPSPKRYYDKHHPHLSTARLLAQRKTGISTP